MICNALDVNIYCAHAWIRLVVHTIASEETFGIQHFTIYILEF